MSLQTTSKTQSINVENLVQCPFAQLMPAPVCPKLNQLYPLCDALSPSCCLQRLPKDKSEGLTKGVRADHIPDRVNQLGAAGVMSLRPVVACPVYPKMKLVKGARADDVHCPWLEVHQHDTWHIASSSCFAEVDIDAFKLKLQVRIALVADYLPKLGSKFIPVLTALDVGKTQPTNMLLLLLVLLLLLLLLMSLGL